MRSVTTFVPQQWQKPRVGKNDPRAWRSSAARAFDVVLAGGLSLAVEALRDRSI